jgi:two-component system chemotaxis response regulator CheY
MEYYSIGKLSKLAHISTDTLRHYDTIGLLKPAHVDRDSGYRYYTLDHAVILARIMEFKEFGFSLNEIKEILDERDTTAVFSRRYAELLQQKHHLNRAIDKLAVKIKHQQEEAIMNKKVLLVDDANFMRIMCADIFSKNGYTVLGESNGAHNGQEAVEMYKTTAPDIVIMDIVMPEMDGISAVRKINEYDPSAKILMLSAVCQPAMVIDALIAGAANFVSKPFHAELLLETARAVFTDETTLNRDYLTELKTKSDVAANYLLSQPQIEELVKAAKSCDSEYRNSAERVFAGLPAATIPSGESAPDNNSQMMQLLQKIVQGQEEMKELLKQIVKQ